MVAAAAVTGEALDLKSSRKTSHLDSILAFLLFQPEVLGSGHTVTSLSFGLEKSTDVPFARSGALLRAHVRSRLWSRQSPQA